tara:strand:+ start:542 stop:997 length:456 start_codon:yes stop_codon:yes gene_type:complete
VTGACPFELTLLRLEDAMDASGDFFRIHGLMGRQWFTWNRVGSLSRSRPKTSFIINDKHAAYTLSGRPEKGYIANSMNRKLKQLFDNTAIEGATPAAFRDSFIRMMYQDGCGYKDLMDITGIRQKETLDRKIKPCSIELLSVYQSLYSKVF